MLRIIQRELGKSLIIQKRYKTFLPTHEWLTDDHPIKKIGIAKSGLEQLSELVYIEYSVEKNDIIQEGEPLVILESVKATEEILAPFNSEIIDINENYDLDLINENPECEDGAWLIKLKSISKEEN